MCSISVRHRAKRQRSWEAGSVRAACCWQTISAIRGEGVAAQPGNPGRGRLLVTSEDPEISNLCIRLFFDKILLDAPCLGRACSEKRAQCCATTVKMGRSIMCRSRKTDRAGVSDACRGRRAAVLYLYVFCKRRTKRSSLGLLDAHPDMEVQEITPGYRKGFAPGYP